MTGEKSIERYDIETIDDLEAIGQLVIDTFHRHNGMTPPSITARLKPPKTQPPQTQPEDDLPLIKEILDAYDPDIGYNVWLHAAMAVSHATGNSDKGYQLFDDWSSRGTKYKGQEETRRTWDALADEPDNPITIATLIKQAKEYGVDTGAILKRHRSGFVKVPFEVIHPPGSSVQGQSDLEAVQPLACDEADSGFRKLPTSSQDANHTPEEPSKPDKYNEFRNPFRQFALNGQSEALARQLRDEVFVLELIALLGQATMLYGPANAGKTLLGLSLLIDAISDGRIQAEHIFYINSDDALKGLVEKVQIAEEHGFMMVADGYSGFENKDLLSYIGQLDSPASAAGVVIVIDTVKKFTDLMSKKESSNFTAGIRRFISKGGTVIGLGHVNKQRGANDKLVYAGTTDIIDDFDCAYVIDVVEDGYASGTRVVEFENKKLRGSVAPRVGFSYLHPSSVSCYRDMLDSVARLPDEEVQDLATATRLRRDAPLIEIVETSIKSGRNAKKDLIAALRGQGQLSRAKAAAFIEQYCGDDPTVHIWCFTRGASGTHAYSLLKDEDPQIPGDNTDA
jgi:hypothetical protein